MNTENSDLPESGDEQKSAAGTPNADTTASVVNDAAAPDTAPSTTQEDHGDREEPVADTTDYGPQANVTLTLGSPLGLPLKKKDDPKNPNQKISIPPVSFVDYQNYVNGYAKMELAENAESEAWGQAAHDATKLYMNARTFDASFMREGSAWGQAVSAGADNLRADSPKFADNGGQVVSGEQARLRIKSMISAGTRVRIPLWHSGVWVTIKAPSEVALLALDDRIADEKINLGRSSNGIAFANSSVYQSAYVLDLIFEHITETSYQDNNIEALRDVILQPDYMQLVWGTLCAIYPDGYMYEQPCMVNPLKCMHVETARLSFGKISFVDNNAFTDFQREHMRKRKTGTQSKEDVARYQREHKFSKNSVIDLFEGLKLEFKVPTLSEYLTEGRSWVERSIALVDQAFDRELNEAERNKYIDLRAGLTVMQQYSHWVRIFSITEDDKRIEDPDTIRDLLSDLASSDEVFQNFFKGIRAYIDGIMINVHGLPKYQCPRCKQTPTEEQMKHPAIFPIDLVEAFFTLVGQRIRLILSRRLN